MRMNEENKHQPDCVIYNGWLLFPDGTLRENRQGQFAVTKRPEDERERLQLICKFWELKLDLGVREFDHQKTTWLAAARARLGDKDSRGGPDVETAQAVAVLNGLKAKVRDCQEKLSDAERQLEQHSPKKSQAIEDIGRKMTVEFINAVEQIEI